VLVVGGGPAGLEAALWLGRRGYEVVLTEASRQLGGRVALEARLPGLAEWGRVADHRILQLRQLEHVLVTLESPMTADEIVGYDFTHVAVATGSRWRDDGLGIWHHRPVFTDAFAVDEVLAGRRPTGKRVTLFDDEHYYLGGVLAEHLARAGHDVTLVTPESKVSNWTVNTMEQTRIHRRLVEAGVVLHLNTAVLAHGDGSALLADTYTGREHTMASDALVSVTCRVPNDRLVDELRTLGFANVQAIGDAHNPGIIADATFDGRRYAEDFDGPVPDHGATPFRREVVRLA
jgi:dimethylamine/trimethylamine dehydrogenase